MPAQKSRPRRPDPSAAPKASVSARSRDMGQWSFLTWSFFLSQVLSSEQFLGASAAAAQTAPDGSSPQDAVVERNLTDAPPAIVHGAAGQGEGSTAAPATLLANHFGNFPPIKIDAVGVGPHDGVLPHGGTGGAGAMSSLVGDAVVGSDQFVGQHTAGGDGSSPLAASPGLDHLDLGGILSPVLHDIGTSVLAPVTATLDSALQAVTQITHSVVDLTGEIVHAAATDVSGIIAPLPGALGTALQPVVGVVAIESAHLGTVANSTLSVLTDGLANTLGNSLAQGIFNTPGHQDVASGGMLSFSTPSGGGVAGIDALFSSKGGYTSYNLALHGLGGSDNGAVPGLAGIGSELTSLVDHLLPGTHAGGPAADSHAQALNPAVPSALDELHLRGFGDGITV